MKLLNDESKLSVTEACAAKAVETIPLIMATIRAKVRACLPEDLTLPQFRALAYINRHPGTSLSTIAECLGLTLSSVSKIIDALVKRGDVRHTVSRTDRRLAKLALTKQGVASLQAATAEAQDRLAVLLAPLADEECAVVMTVLDRLSQICQPAYTHTDVCSTATK